MEDGKAMINIIYEDNHLLVVEKPINIPVQKDSSNDNDLLTMLKTYLKEKYQKPGNVYLGLVHRLDRPVGGIMVFAKTSKAASRLSEQIRNKTFQKTYVAVVHGHIEKEATFTDKLLKNHQTNITTISSKGKEIFYHRNGRGGGSVLGIMRHDCGIRGQGAGEHGIGDRSQRLQRYKSIYR